MTLPPEVHNLEIYKIAGMKAPPLGLAYIASMLEKAGHKVRILDTPTLEMNKDQWIREVKSWSPDAVGISLLTPLAPKGYEAVRLIREELGQIPVFAGGIHPSFMYDEALDHGFDVVVRGEGEITTRELIDMLEKKGLEKEYLKKVMGIAFRDKDGKTILTPPRPLVTKLDELPYPAYHLLPMEKYRLFNKPIRVAHILATRGCPYGCMYCSTSYYWGRRIRYRSGENVAREIEYLHDKYHVKYISFADDELTIARKTVDGFISELKERGIDIKFACGSRVDHVDKNYMKYLYDNGCAALYFGVESSSQFTLDRIGKRITIERIKKVFEWRKELGGFAMGSFILGFPWETTEDMKRTIDFAIKLDPSYAQFTALTPYPGTPFYRYAKMYNLIVDNNWEHYTTIRAVIKGFNFTREQLASMVKYAYRKFFIRWGFLKREIEAGRLKDILGIVLKEALSLTKDIVVHPLRWLTRT